MAMGETKVNSYRNSAQGRSTHLDNHLRALPFSRMEDNAAAWAGSPRRGATAGQIPFKTELSPPKFAPKQ
jgi:hypothetical protein